MLPEKGGTEGIFQEVVGFSLFHVPGRYLKLELSIGEFIADLFSQKVGEYFDKSFILDVASFEFPVRHLDVDFSAVMIRAALADQIEHFNEIFLSAFPEVGGLQPEHLYFSLFEGGDDSLVYSEEGVVVDVEAVVDDLEGAQLLAELSCVDQVLSEVVFHELFDFGEISVAAAFEF